MNNTNNNNKVIWIIAIILFVISITLIIFTQSYKTNRQKLIPTPTEAPTLTLAPSPTFYPIEKAIQLQTVADQNWGQAVIERDRFYPWLNKLPLQTDDYFVYFDVEKKKFIGEIYGQTGENTFIKKQIILTLSDMGIDAESYGIIWK